MRTIATAAVATAALALVGCGEFWLNNTKKLEGTVTVSFVNNTESDAVLTAAVWNDLDRPSERAVQFVQPRVLRLSRTDDFTLACARNLAIGTQQMVDWVLESTALEDPEFDPAALNADVFFNREDDGSPAENAPVDGRAAGVGLLVGVDYSCGDRIVFTFEEDADVDGGFRVDYAVIRDENRDD